MSFSWSIFVLSIFWLIEDSISLNYASLQKEYINAALPLIKNHDSSLKLAVPDHYHDDFAVYSYADSEDQNGREEFVMACPARFNALLESKIEQNLKENGKLSEDSKLFIVHEYFSNKADSKCSSDVIPSIKKKEVYDGWGNAKYCGDFEAEIYNVGYPVFDEKKNDIQFISIYKICYSTVENKGMMYTIHRISSPKLLLQKLWEFYVIDPKLSFKSSLDKSEDENKSPFKHQYVYQYVGFDDMPIKPWKHPTAFSFNYIPIPKNKDLFMGMIAADNYIRLFSKETNKPLTLHSGLYQTTKYIPPAHCLAKLCDSKPTQINSFWRVITDDENHAVIMITQLTLIKCDEYFICQKNRVIVQKYKKGGCTYTCSVDNIITSELGLPRLTISGDLDLTFPQKIPSGVTDDGQQLSKVNTNKIFSMLDFMGKGKFRSTLADADPNLAAAVDVKSPKEVRGYIAYKPPSENCGGSGGTGCFGGGARSDGGGGSSWFWWGAGAGGVAGGDYGGGDYGGGGGGDFGGGD